MNRRTYQREILSRLARIESNLDKISLELAERVEKQKQTAAAVPGDPEKTPDEWVQQGIDNIMSFQVGKKKEGDR